MSKVLYMKDFDDLLSAEHYNFLIDMEDLEHEANWDDDNSFTADDIPF
mgnify:CR=1 FL=1|tara:strand:+ start:95 stop:238 length:144 start_codon:yes stop_codon:yes gene_type:complete